MAPQPLEERCVLTAAPQMLADVNTLAISLYYPTQIAALGDDVYFVAQDGAGYAGSELWKTDGTAAGTQLVRDIWSGPSYSSIEELTVFGDKLVFTADDGIHGKELWVSDGTKDGTVMVRDISAAGGSNLAMLTVVGGALYFVANSDNDGEFELWKYDGTTASFVEEISNSIESLTAVGDKLFFVAIAEGGAELWKSDGTAATTNRVRDIVPGTGWSAPHNLTAVGDMLYFAAFDVNNDVELWKSDGTAAGTVRVADLNTAGSFGPAYLTNLNGTLYFTGSDGINGVELWKLNAAGNGAELVADLNASAGLGSNPMNLTAVGDVLYFTADDGVHGRELWMADAEGASLVADLRADNDSSAANAPSKLTAVGDVLYFSADDGINGRELWKFDVNVDTAPVLVRNITADGGSSNPDVLTNVNGTLYFQARDNSGSSRLWKSDGTVGGTVIAVDTTSYLTQGSAPEQFVRSGLYTYFRLDDGVNGTELWRTDGTAAGTQLVADIRRPDTAERNDWKYTYAWEGSYPSLLVDVDGTLYFAADNEGTSVHSNREVWKTTGTGASKVTSFIPDWNANSPPYSTSPSYLTSSGGRLYFVAYHFNYGSSGRLGGEELWWYGESGLDSDDLYPDPIGWQGPAAIGSGPRFLTDVNGTLFFVASSPTHGTELHKIGATDTSISLVRDITPGSDGTSFSFGYERNLVNVDGTLFFYAYDSANGYALWKSDGTSDGTQIVKILASLSDGYPSIGNLTAAGNKAFFTAYDPDDGYVLWVSDGTEAGTKQVYDLIDGTASTQYEGSLLGVGSDLYFLRRGQNLYGGGSETQLWKTDGDTTVMLRNFGSGASISELTNVNGALYFNGWDLEHGNELWISDGTVDGTKLLADLWEGLGSSNPQHLAASGEKLYFAANDGRYGIEAWVYSTLVNQAPSFTIGPNQTILNGAPLQTVAGFATNISPGPAGEENQTVQFVVTNDNPNLFTTQPTISADGTLRYDPKANVTGTATVTVRLRDDGGIAGGGENESAPQTFTITVNPINRAPSFTFTDDFFPLHIIGDAQEHEVLADAGPQSYRVIANMSAGAAWETDQTWQFEVSIDSANAYAFLVPPSISPDGILTYTPNPNQIGGTLPVTVTMRDNGGTDFGGDDSTSKSFYIRISHDRVVSATVLKSTYTAGQAFDLAVKVWNNFSKKYKTSSLIDVVVELAESPEGATLRGKNLTAEFRNGQAVFSGLNVDKVGFYTLRVRTNDASTNLPGVALTTRFEVLPSTAIKTLELTTPPAAAAVAGTPIGLAIKAYDAFGNVAATSTAKVTATIATKTDRSGTLGGTSVQLKNGIAVFDKLVLNKVGDYTLTLAIGSVKIGTGTIHVNPAAASTLKLVTQPPSSVTAGGGFGLEARAYDVFGNLATGFTGQITAELLKNPGAATLGGTTTVAAVAGVVTFTDLTLDKAKSGYTLQLKGAGDLASAKPPATSSIKVNPGVMTQLVVSKQPPITVVAGSGITVTVAAQDAFGNVVTGFKGPVTIKLKDNPAGGTLEGTMTRNASSGVATFSNLVLKRAGTDYTLEATAGANAVTTSGFAVVAAAPKLVVILPQISIVAGQTFQVLVEARDQFGNLAVSYLNQLTASLGSNPTKAVLGGVLVASPDQGVATFNLTISKSGTGYKLKFGGKSVSTLTTQAFTVT